MRDLIEFLKTRFAHHYDCEDGCYSCPKSDGYFGPDKHEECSCGKDEADRLIREYEERYTIT